MLLTNNTNLSNTMIDVLEKMDQHNGILIRFYGGWWSWENAEIKHYMRKEANKTPQFTRDKVQDDDYAIPIWNCDVKTLRALQKRGLVILEEDNNICRLKK